MKIFPLIIFVFLSISEANALNINQPIIPAPQQFTITKGCFELNHQTILAIKNPSENLSDAEVFNQYLQQYYGFSLPVTADASGEKNIIKIISCNDPEWHTDEYRMLITKDSVLIKGKGAGVFYALQSLRQMLPPSKNKKLTVNCCSIKDYPHYNWRGMHLDVCRHFFTVAEVKKYIDLIAFYKMNMFHWHLTDDQGWRIAIEKYPLLTTKGACRNGTLIGHYHDGPHRFDSIRYCGYYSKEDIREIVRYAAERHITVVPEIEMPGHAMAALTAYPEYSCTGGPFETAMLWGVFDDVFCAKDETFPFIENILKEVIALFPGKYIHIGGDECPKTRWKDCQYCQAVMKREGLKDEHELQSYFIRKIEKFVNANGKVIIGWDEILEGGLAPNAVVMSWRGAEGGIAAAKQGHFAVMCPGGYCYFDHYQGNPAREPLAIGGNTSMKKVYSYEPCPKELNENEKTFIMGAQGNIWTEYIPDYQKVEYMALPRMSALSEVLWLPSDRKNYENFSERIQNHFKMLDFMGINHAIPEE